MTLARRTHDPRQLTIPGSELVCRGPQEALIEAVLAAIAREDDVFTKNTAKSYASAARSYARWCDRTGAQALPLVPRELTGYLEHLSRQGGRPNTVRAHLFALCSLDVLARKTPTETSPTSVFEHHSVKAWYRSWAREHPRAPHKRAPVIECSDLWRLLTAIQEPTPRCARAAHVLRATRDKAMVLVGIYGGLRVAELAELDTTQLRFVARGLELFVARGKRDQEGVGKWKGILPATQPGLCAVEAYRAWLAARGTWEGPAFPAIERDKTLGTTPMHPRSLQKILTTHAKRAGLDGVSSHSMRATLATLSSRRGHRLEHVSEHLGHTSLQTTVGYVRRGQLFSDANPTGGLFDE